MKIGILGCKGRMGQTLMTEVTRRKDVTLVGGIDKGDKADSFIAECDALIDFTHPESSVQFAWDAAKHRKIHVIGTTGFTNEQLDKIKEYAKETVIFHSANMSVGVNVVAALVRRAAEMLDDSYDIEIFEMHHRMKIDSPSGTALLLGEAASEGRKIAFRRDVEHNRGGVRNKGDIGYGALRGGNIIGDHTVFFAGEEDRIEITHKSSSRDIYASGAIKAALWCNGKKPGFYNMRDMLSF